MDYKLYRLLVHDGVKLWGGFFTSTSATGATSTAEWFADLRGWRLISVKGPYDPNTKELLRADIPAVH